jgi:hypothetical protein
MRDMDGKLKRATKPAAQSCSGTRRRLQNLSSTIKRNREKSTIDHNKATARHFVR